MCMQMGMTMYMWSIDGWHMIYVYVFVGCNLAVSEFKGDSYTHLYIYTCMHAYTRIYIYIYAYIYIYIYILINREDNEHLKHVCMRTNIVTEPDTAWQGNRSCIENYAGSPFKSTFGTHYSKPIKPISVESNLI